MNSPGFRFQFNPAAPGAIGATTPAPITATTLNLVDGSMVIAGTVSTTTGITISGGTLRLFGGGVQGLVMDANGTGVATPFITGQRCIINISGVAMYAAAGGVIFDHYTNGASASVDGTEDTLYTDTLPAGALNSNGAKLRGYYQLAIIGHAISTNRIRLYFGGTAIFDSGAVNWPLDAVATINFEIIRVSSSVVRACVSVSTTTATVIPYSVYTEITGLTLSATQVIALKDISTGTNSAVADVTAKLASIWWHPYANVSAAT